MAAILPALLPSPPRSQMLPLLPTPCLVILPANFAPPSSRPGRADAADRWDASKKKPSIPAPSSSRSLGGANSVDGRDAIKKPNSPVSSSSGSSSRSPGRADAADRWDVNKKPSSPVSSSSGSSGSPGRADAVDRWDENKKLSTSPVSSRGSSSGIPGRASSCDRWDSNKLKNPGGTSSKRPTGHASSADRWDIHKKPRQQQDGDCDLVIKNGAQTETDEKMEASIVEVVKPPAAFSGASFFFPSPEPSMLPMPCLRA